MAMDLQTNISTIPLQPSMDRSLGDLKPELTATAPGQLRVIRRNGSVTSYDDGKIAIAMTKAFLAVEGGNAAASTRVRQLVTELTAQITETFKRQWPTGGTIHIESIQDLVELSLMRAGEHKVARAYVLYREERRKARQQQTINKSPTSDEIHITLKDGSQIPLDMARLSRITQEACQGLRDVNAEIILKDVARNLFDGVSIDDVNKALIMSARVL